MKKQITMLTLASALLLSGCSGNTDDSTGATTTAAETSVTTVQDTAETSETAEQEENRIFIMTIFKGVTYYEKQISE